MTFYHGPSERERKERDTPERIVQLARAKGEFRVSLRYRDDWLRRRCAKLKQDGLLVGGRRLGREVIYYAATTPPPPSAEPGATGTANNQPTQRNQP